MLGSIKKVICFLIAIAALIFIMFIINQTSQLVSLMSGISPLLGRVTLYTLLFVYTTAVALSLYAVFSRPAALVPPKEAEGEEYIAYIGMLAKRLQKNPHIDGSKIEAANISSLKDALKTLDSKADEAIKTSASGVFIMTAISQYGALDALIVALTQLRMIWQVTLLYNQRPKLRDLTYLYGNVFATAFLAAKIENLDLLEEQLEPVIASIMGSSLSSFTPALNTAANVVTNSILQGSANAFLTLRVGVITKKYCSSLIREERSSLRRIASVQAAAMLAKVLGESSYKVTRAIFRATAKTSRRPFRYGQDLFNQTSKKTRDAGQVTLRKGEDLAKNLGDAVKKGGRKIKLYFANPEPESESEPEE